MVASISLVLLPINREDNLKELSRIGMVFSIVLFVITLSIMTMIYFRLVLNRSIEISLLKANGLTNLQIVRLILTELGLHILIVMIGAFISHFIFIKLLNILYPYQLVFESIYAGLVPFILCIILFLLPTLIILKYTLRYEPTELLRND